MQGLKVDKLTRGNPYTVRVKNKLYIFQNKTATKSKQNSNKIKTKQQQNHDLV